MSASLAPKMLVYIVAAQAGMSRECLLCHRKVQVFRSAFTELIGGVVVLRSPLLAGHDCVSSVSEEESS